MKKIFTRTFLVDLVILTVAFIILFVFLQSCSFSESTVITTKNQKGQQAKKDKDVKIYPDVWKRLMHVKNIESEALDFYVFDIDGSIMIHYKMDEKDHKKIYGLDRGTYTYQVFKKDEMSESGRLVIK